MEGLPSRRSERYKQMMLDAHEFIRRFLMHVLPQGFHRIRYYGFLTCQTRARNIARIRELLAVSLIPIDAIKTLNAKPEEPKAQKHPCPCTGSSQNTALRRLLGPSGSTRHDAGTIDPPSHRAPPFRLTSDRQRSRLHRRARSAPRPTPNPRAQRSVRAFKVKATNTF